MEATGAPHIKQDMSSSERQVSDVFTQMWNLDLKLSLKNDMIIKGGFLGWTSGWGRDT
jgi:hypothetical protein